MAEKRGDAPITPVNIPLNGRLVTAVSGPEAGQGNFQTQTNMRPSATAPKGISGMTKAVTNKINATYYKPRAAHHFRKSQPSESHVLVQAFNSGMTASRIYENTTAIPSVGDFDSTALYTTGDTIGSFSDSPDGTVLYCDGDRSLFWGGDEYRCGGFVVFDPAGTFKYRYSDRVTNTLTDAANIASMKSVAASVDSSTIALWHLDNALTDSSANGLTLTNVDVTFTATDAPYGTHWAAFNGTSSYLYHADNAKFYFNNDAFTIEATIRTPDTAPTRQQTIYSQSTSTTGYIVFRITGTGLLQFALFSSLETKLSLTGTTVLADNTTYKVAVVEDGDNYYLFIDGILEASTVSTERPENYTGPACIGILEAGDPIFLNFEGNIDEVRLSSVARYTTDYSPEPTAFGSVPICHAYVYSTRALRGVKWYIATANDSAATSQGYYWNGNSWVTVGTITDGTTSSGKTLAQTGSMSFTSTVGLAKPKIIDGIMAYVYYFKFFNLNNTTYPTVSYMTLDTPMQPIVDVWGGEYTPVLVVWKKTYASTNNMYRDYTSNALNQDAATYAVYNGTDVDLTYLPYTYVKLGSLTTNDAMILGFEQPTCGVALDMLKNLAGNSYVNTASAVLTVKAWDGAQFTEVDNLVDGTANETGTISLNHSGIISWSPCGTDEEFTTSINNDQQLYYYEFSWSNSLDALVGIDRIRGIPSPRTIGAYKFPYMWNNRSILACDDSFEKNAMEISAYNTDCVWNGSDYTKVYFGNNEELTACGKLFNRDNNGIYESLIVCKANATYVLEGSSPKDYKVKTLSENYGCVAPKTMTVCDTGFEIAEGVNKHVLIWLSANGWVLCDNSTVVSIDNDIANYFDELKPECINRTYIDDSIAFYDALKKTVHGMIPSGSTATGPNVEIALDIVRKKWFKIDRGTGKMIILGLSVRDTIGNYYPYGFTDGGYMYRLEYGTTFDGNNLTYTLRTADIPMPDVLHEELVRYARAIFAQKTGGGTVTVKYYINTKSTAVTLGTVSLADSTHTWSQDLFSINPGEGILHSFEFTYTNGTETAGFEPIAFALFIEGIRETRRNQCQ